jgi:2-oxoisovalerate ferredoxin oxidoreductase delta subunit
VFCPEGAVELEEDGFVKINYSYCKGCGICANECYPKAITMKR